MRLKYVEKIKLNTSGYLFEKSQLPLEEYFVYIYMIYIYLLKCYVRVVTLLYIKKKNKLFTEITFFWSRVHSVNKIKEKNLFFLIYFFIHLILLLKLINFLVFNLKARLCVVLFNSSPS